MKQLLVFNHHSLPFKSKEDADSAIPEFIKICLKANNLGLTTILFNEDIDHKWFRLLLAPNYYWQDWYKINDNDKNKDLVRAFHRIQTRQPYYSSDDIGAGSDLFEVKFKDESKYYALCAAVWHESPIVSFPICDPWNTTPIIVSVNSIDEDSEISSYDYKILNLHSLDILKNNEKYFIQQRDLSINTGKDLYARRKELFPFLEFCGKAIEQLNYWEGTFAMLEHVKESLNSLNLLSEKIREGEYRHYSHENLKACGLNHEVSGESETVMNTPSLRKEREFWLPNGEKKYFENHIKLTKGFRIHFFHDLQSKMLYVGYIGEHLRLK